MVQAGEAGPRLEGLSSSLDSPGRPIQPLCHCSDPHHPFYYFWLLFTEHLLYARHYAKSLASILSLCASSHLPQAHRTPGETGPDLAPCGTVRKRQSLGAEREFLLSSFQPVEDNTDLHAPLPAYSLFLPILLLIPHTPLPTPRVTPPSPVLDVQDDLKSIY